MSGLSLEQIAELDSQIEFRIHDAVLARELLAHTKRLDVHRDLQDRMLERLDALERSHPAKGDDLTGKDLAALHYWRAAAQGARTAAERAERERDETRESRDNWKATAVVMADERDAARADADRMREALQRLASTEAFVSAIDINHAPREAIIAEIMARGRYAQAALDSTRGDA